MINDRDYEEEYSLAFNNRGYGVITSDMKIIDCSPMAQANEVLNIFKNCLNKPDPNLKP